MLKFLLTAAPYLLKAPSQSSQKQIARSFTALVLFAFSGITLCVAIFIFITSLYGPAIGFLCISVLLLLAGLALSYKAKHPTKSAVPAQNMSESQDPIAALVPDLILEDPTVKKALGHVSSNPVAASLAAVAIGMLITREFMKD